MEYRQLTNTEIQALRERGCTATDWSAVCVSDDFRVEQLRNVTFRTSGKKSAAGVLDETGENEVVLSASLTSPLAHWIARSANPQLREALNRMLAETETAGTCYIGANAEVHDALLIDTIVASDAEIGDGVVLERCFVGEGCSVEKQYSGMDSLFFANCQFAHGEACAVLAGPYTVSHHKASLLIGGQYSFYNAGSSTNYSNHLYKKGPVHWGVLERGAKTASGAHVVWPARVGAFTMVMGKHAGHPDTALFPFSYLIQDDGKSWLAPGANMATLGTWRDSGKWPKRDRRKTAKRDRINFGVFSPAVLSAMAKGLNILRELAKLDEAVIAYEGVYMRRSAILKGIAMYETVLAAYPLPTDAEQVIDLGGEWVNRADLQRLEAAILCGEMKTIDEVQASLDAMQLSDIETVWPDAIMSLIERDGEKEKQLINTWKQHLLY